MLSFVSDSSKIENDSLFLDGIEPEFTRGMSSAEIEKEIQAITLLLRKILPPKAFFEEIISHTWLQKHLPYVSWLFHHPSLFRHSFFLLCPKSIEFNQEEFFQDMIRKHLIPGNEVMLVDFRMHSFFIGEKHSAPFLLIEASVHVEEKKLIELMNNHSALFSELVAWGCSSPKTSSFALTNVYQAKSWERMLNSNKKIIGFKKIFS